MKINSKNLDIDNLSSAEKDDLIKILQKQCSSLTKESDRLEARLKVLEDSYTKNSNNKS